MDIEKYNVGRMDKLVEIANSFSNEDICSFIPLISDRIALWDNKGSQCYKIGFAKGEEERWHSLNGNQVQVEITKDDDNW